MTARNHRRDRANVARRALAACLTTALVLLFAAADVHAARLLYVAAPGIRNDLQYGGAGLLVFDIDAGYRFVRRIPTPASAVAKPENIKGICASAKTGRLYYTTPTRLYCMEIIGQRPLWDRALPGGCDRMSLVPDGSLLYVPSFEGGTWNVVEGDTGGVTATITAHSGAHNTVCGQSGRQMYLGGLRSPMLRIADTGTHRVLRTVGPFGGSIRPFTVDGGETRAFVCVNDLLGFEIGDLASGRLLVRVEVAGYKRGPTARHGCPSHGIALTPDGKEIWLCDSHNRRLHVFDVTAPSPKQVASVPLRDEPGWVSFSIDGRHAYSSTGEVIDRGRRQVIATLEDEKGRHVQSEKLLEIDFASNKPIRCGDQFGVGRSAAGRNVHLVH